MATEQFDKVIERLTTLLAELNAKTEPADTQTVSGAVTVGSGTVAVSSLPALIAGTANIGDVDVLTIAGGTTRIGGTYNVGGTVIDEVPTVRTINRDFLNATLIGNTQIVAAQGANVRIRVLGLVVVGTLAVTIKLQSATTDITAGFPIATTGGFLFPYNPHGWFQTTANEALNLNLSLATAVGMNIIWVQAT